MGLFNPVGGVYIDLRKLTSKSTAAVEGRKMVARGVISLKIRAEKGVFMTTSNR